MSTLSCSSLFEPHYPTRAAVGVGRWRATNNFCQRIYRREQKSNFEDRTQDLMRWDEYVVLYSPSAVPHPIEEQTCKSALMAPGAMPHHQ